MSDTYAGYANRETYEVCLWLENDRVMFDSATDITARGMAEADRHEGKDY